MPAPKGNQYAVGNKGQPPSKYTPEFIEKEAEELLKWCRKEDSYYLKGFALERGYHPEYLSRWSKKNQVFNHAFIQATHWQEFRLFKDALQNKINPGIAKWGLACNHKWKEPPTEVINTTSKSGAEQYEEEMKSGYTSKDESKADS